MPDEFKIIWILSIGLGLACFFGFLAQKIRLSPLLGYLFAGYMIGPNFPGFVADQQISQELASIGVTLLMFAVGLNFNWKDLIEVRKLAVPGALILSTISIIVGLLLSVSLGQTVKAGLVIGLAICVSSTVVIVRILTDQQLLHTKQGHAVLGWTIVEDLISVFGLLLLPTFIVPTLAGNSPLFEFAHAAFWVLLKIFTLGLIVYLLGEQLVDKLLKIVARTRSHELFTLAILSFVFFIAIGSSLFFGVSLALGAFIAGTVVGKTELSHQAAANALPMRDAFAVIFFLSVGMLFNPLAIFNNFELFLGVLLIILLLRPVFAFLIIKLARYPKTLAITIAIAISQIGEYSFILAQEGSKLMILPRNAFDILVACSFVSIMINPFLFKIFTSYVHSYLPSLNKEKSHFFSFSDFQKSEILPKAIVVGYGVVGEAATKMLNKKKHNVIIVERNIDTVINLKEKGIDAIFGDAAQFRILEKVDLANIQHLIITIPNANMTHAIIKTALHINPFVNIIARCHFKVEKSKFGEIPTICDEEAAAEKMMDEIENQISL